MTKCKLQFLCCFILTTYFISGCASVRVIGPVARQNERNASALEDNLRTLLSISDEAFPTLIDIALVDTYRDTMIAIRKSKYKPKEMVESQIAIEYENNAKSLKNEIEQLDLDLRTTQIEQSHRSFPITAEVAFKDMEPKEAAALWLALDSTYNMTLAMGEKFKIRKHLIRNLYVIASHHQAKTDIMDAYNELRSAVLQQAMNSKKLAEQFREASETGSDPSAFLRGVLEDNRVIELIGETVVHRTRSPERKKAAEELLASVRGEDGINETANIQ